MDWKYTINDHARRNISSNVGYSLENDNNGIALSAHWFIPYITGIYHFDLSSRTLLVGVRHVGFTAKRLNSRWFMRRDCYLHHTHRQPEQAFSRTIDCELFSLYQPCCAHNHSTIMISSDPQWFARKIRIDAWEIWTTWNKVLNVLNRLYNHS